MPLLLPFCQIDFLLKIKMLQSEDESSKGSKRALTATLSDESAFVLTAKIRSEKHSRHSNLIWTSFYSISFLATAFLKLVSLEDRMNMLSISFHERSQEKWYFTLKIAKVNKLGNCQDIRVINTSLCNVFRFWSQKEHASLKSCNFL